MAELELPRTDSGVVTSLFAMVGPRDVGKTTMAAILAPMLAPKERIICAGPVPTMAERMGVPWHKVSRLDKAGADKFFSGLERSDASFFLCLDEADSFLGASQFYSQPLQEWVRDNRNFGQGGLLIGHSVGEVAKSFINNCDVVFFFRSSVPGTRDWLRKYARGDMEEIDEVVANLHAHQALVWAPKQDPKCLGIAMADPKAGEIRIVSMEEVGARRENARGGTTTRLDGTSAPSAVGTFPAEEGTSGG